jgi:hypothetical protein
MPAVITLDHPTSVVEVVVVLELLAEMELVATVVREELEFRSQ